MAISTPTGYQEGPTYPKLTLINYHHRDSAKDMLGKCPVIYEGVPEVMPAKEEAFAFISAVARHNAVVASTTSTFLVTELARLTGSPERFMNAHWLNPAHLMPLVEISKEEETSAEAVAQLVASLEAIGKKPVVCNASPGYIVPRIQALAMNEAARLVEEGVASVEDKVNQVRTDLGKRIDQTNTKLDQVRTELKEEIGGLRSEMNTRLSEQTDLLRQIAHNTKWN